MKYRIPVTFKMEFVHEIEADSELSACAAVMKLIDDGKIQPNIFTEGGLPTGVPNSLAIDYNRLRAGA